MRALGVCLVTVALLACSPRESGLDGSVVTTLPDAGPPPTHRLTIRIVGTGTVRSADPQFTCSGDCKQEVVEGTTMNLTAVAESGSSFDGWQGDCAGAGACMPLMSGDRSVLATFTTLPPPPPGQVRVSVVLTGKGNGHVSSTPAGIDCPSACAATFAVGTAVTLQASPDAASTFAGFGGGCSGMTCSFTAGADVTAWTDFEANTPPPTAKCNGLMPDKLPSAVAAAFDATAWCAPGVGSADGAIGLETHDTDGLVLHVVDEATGALRGDTGTSFAHLSGGFTQQPNGFVFAGHDASGTYGLGAWDSQCRFVKASPTFGGSVVGFHPSEVSGVLAGGDFNDAQGGHQLRLYSGADASLVFSATLASKGFVYGLGTDEKGNALVITGPPDGSVTGQWFSPDGKAQTGEFVILKTFDSGPGTWFETAPLIGVGVAIRRVDQLIDKNGAPYENAQWLAAVKSGDSTPTDVPDWLKSRSNTNLAQVRGAKAYAVLPLGAPDSDCGQKIEILAPDGTSCGNVDVGFGVGKCRTFDVTIGRDGTPIQTAPPDKPNQCSWRWFPGALR